MTHLPNPRLGAHPMSASDPKLVERLRYKAADAAKRLIDWRFGNDNEPPRISIPARPDEDDDLVLVTTLKDAASALEAAEAQVAALEAENGALREGLTKIEALGFVPINKVPGETLDQTAAKLLYRQWKACMDLARAALRQAEEKSDG